MDTSGRSTRHARRRLGAALLLPAARLLVVAAAGAAALLAAAPARADLVVTTTADELNTDGDCSLREAIVAANLNQVRDACGSGTNAQSDRIVLASGATYSLTIPGPGGQGAAGALAVTNGGAGVDLEISVAGGGKATISQEAANEPVFSIAAGARLEVSDVAIQGGRGASNGGGAAFVGTGSRLVLTRCVVRRNSAEGNGGAIRNNGELAVVDSSFIGNVSGTEGGAISTGSSATTVIDRTAFRDNVANGNGGAIANAATLSVSNSVFVDNRGQGPFGVGGAISNGNPVAEMASIGTSCFIGNEATFSGKSVHTFNGAAELAAVGNWWGASNGPSGAGSGAGDGVGGAVDFAFFLTAPPAVCLPLELLANGGFQTDVDGITGDDVPDRWVAARLQTSQEGRFCNAAGKCFVKMRGDGEVNQLYQVVPIQGSAGDKLRFSARAKAVDVPSGSGHFRAQLTIVHADGSNQIRTLSFGSGTHGFEKLVDATTASEDYRRIKVELRYSKPSGRVQFDDVSVVREP